VRLSGRGTFVTGGASGIGLGITEVLLRSNSRVIVCGRDKEKLAMVEKRLPGIMTLPCDVSDGRQREDLAADVLGRFPDLDVLVNNDDACGTRKV
jgi:uncharacterized oxidoreductase